MDVLCLGVGEAFDGALGNSSFLVRSRNSLLLVDCGFNAVPAFFRTALEADALDAVYLSHFHADHCFGLPALLTKFWEEHRSKPLTIIGRPGAKERTFQLLNLGYPGILEKLPFELQFIETTNGFRWNEMQMDFAPTKHSELNHAIRINDGTRIVGFSGDGELTTASKELFSTVELLVHEAFTFEINAPNHGTAKSVLEFAKNHCAALKTLAFVHISSKERSGRLKDFEQLGRDVEFKVLIPEPGDLL